MKDQSEYISKEVRIDFIKINGSPIVGKIIEVPHKDVFIVELIVPMSAIKATVCVKGKHLFAVPTGGFYAEAGCGFKHAEKVAK